ncbi:hypothetical protein MPTK1_8g02640 [Marchantia polymorpha subsp. ruderalis]
MEQEIEASQEGSTHPSIEGSQPEQRTLGSGDVFLPINDGTVRQLPNSAGANATTVGGFTELHQAAAYDEIDKVDTILREGNLKVEVATSDGITALHIAAYKGHETIVTSLLHWYGRNPDADINARDNVLGRTALHYAVGGGHQRVVEELIRFPGIDICPEDSVQNLTPLLMEVMKRRGDCSLVLVRTLIDARTDQINCAVGPDARLIDPLPWLQSCPIKLFPSDDVLQKVSSVRPKEESETFKQEYQEIQEQRRKTDGSLSDSKWKKMGTQDRRRLDADLMIREDINRYLKYECSMAGHTIFHLAATQDNAEVLSHLLSSCTRANVNILTADGSGMTPLHCAIRAESRETFDVLMSHREVDVNAVLKSTVDLARPPWTDLKLCWWKHKDSERFRFYEATCVSDTPLHLAIRCCCSFTLRRMVMKFCNHPRFQPSIYNESGVLPLDLVFLRSSCSLQFGNSSVHLHLVLDMLERQPGNQALMNEVNSMKTGAQNFVNSVLVAAALLGGVTFSAIMQGPVDDEVDFSNVPFIMVCLSFWGTSISSFLLSMLTIVSCLLMSRTLQLHRHLHITGFFINTPCTSVRSFYDSIRAQPVYLLTTGISFGILSFVLASWINIQNRFRDRFRYHVFLKLFFLLFFILVEMFYFAQYKKNNLRKSVFISFVYFYFFVISLFCFFFICYS